MHSADVSANSFLNLFHNGRRQLFAKGEIIIHADDKPESIYLIIQGFVKVYSISRDGAEHIRIIYGPGELFPVVGTLKGKTRPVFYEAVTKTQLGSMPRADFMKYIQEHNAAALVLLDQLGEQFDIYAKRLDNLEMTNANERVAYRLLLLAGRFGKWQGNSVTISLPLTHQLLASSLNLARETTSRAMARLENKGLLHYGSNHLISIPDVNNLRALLGDDAN